VRTQLSAAQAEATLLREANADLSEQLSATKLTGDQVERNLKEMEGSVSSLRTEAAKVSSLLQDKEFFLGGAICRARGNSL
jgi:chromosome segregation ATPase